MSNNLPKPNPENFLSVMQVYLDRLVVKKLIPIEYDNAKEEVYYDLVTSFKSELEQQVFRKAIEDFESITNLKDWYNNEEQEYSTDNDKN